MVFFTEISHKLGSFGALHLSMFIHVTGVQYSVPQSNMLKGIVIGIGGRPTR
jgi:hypothetical protein